MYEPKKLNVGIRPFYRDIKEEDQKWKLVIPILTYEDAKQHKLHLQIAWEIFTLFNEKLDALEEDQNIIIKGIPIGIMDIVEKLRDL